MNAPVLLISLIFSVSGMAYEKPEQVPVGPYGQVIREASPKLIVHYEFDGYDSGDDSIEDYIGLEGKPYLEAVELVRPHYRPEDSHNSWRCYKFPKNSTERLCQRAFRGGNFDSVTYFHFSFFLIEDSRGIRMKTNVVNATAYRD